MKRNTMRYLLFATTALLPCGAFAQGVTPGGGGGSGSSITSVNGQIGPAVLITLDGLGGLSPTGDASGTTVTATGRSVAISAADRTAFYPYLDDWAAANTTAQFQAAVATSGGVGAAHVLHVNPGTYTLTATVFTPPGGMLWFDNGATLSGGSITGMTDEGVVGKGLTVVRAMGSRAGEHVLAIEGVALASGATSSYEKEGLYINLQTKDPSDFPGYTLDLAAIEADVAAAGTNSQARLWGMHTSLNFPAGTDGIGYFLEGSLSNNGVGQTLPDQPNSKYGVHLAANGPNVGTAAVYLDENGGSWAYGLVSRQRALSGPLWALLVNTNDNAVLSQADAMGNVDAQEFQAASLTNAPFLYTDGSGNFIKGSCSGLILCATPGTFTLGSIGSGHLLGNATGGSAAAADTSLSSLLDQSLGSTQGSVIYRGASGWAALTPAGSSGGALITGGAAANPSWSSLSPAYTNGTVSGEPSASVAAGTLSLDTTGGRLCASMGGGTWRCVPGNVIQSTGSTAAGLTTGTEENVGVISVPGGMVGANGLVRLTQFWEYAGSDSKTFTTRISTVSGVTAGTSILAAPATATVSFSGCAEFHNNNSTSSQIGVVTAASGTCFGATNNGLISGSIPTASTWYVDLNVTQTSTADVPVLEFWTLEVIQGS